MALVPFTLSVSLFDSISTTQQIVIFILLLTTNKPVRNACWYLAGLSGFYLACGIAGYAGIAWLRQVTSAFIPSAAAVPDPLYYECEFVAGVLMTALGIWYFRSRKRMAPGKTESFVLAKLKSVNGIISFCVGAFISISSFPLSFPYLLVLEKYARLGLSRSLAAGGILVYNIGYASPMIAVLIAYLFARRAADLRHDTLHEKARALNIRLTTAALAGFGLFSMLDAGWFFAFGHALIKGRYY